MRKSRPFKNYAKKQGCELDIDFAFSKPCPKPGSYKSAVQFLDKLWAFSAQMYNKHTRPQAKSNNSWMPSSSDSLKIKAKMKKKNEDWRKLTVEYWRKPKQGAQPGHQVSGRALVNSKEVDKVIKINPDRTCKKCSSSTIGRQI